MENLVDQKELKDITPPYSGLYALINLGWIFISIFKSLDDNRWIFLGLMVAGAILTAYYLVLSRIQKEPLQQTAGIFYVLVWFGISTFSNKSEVVNLPLMNLTIGQLMHIIMLPVLIIWMIPASTDYFFGLEEVTPEDKTKSMWKVSVIIIFLLNIFNLWTIFEVLVLIPLVFEHITLYRMKKEELPILTLHIQKEIFSKFAVPISMLKGVTLIMVVFIFEMLDSRLWLLVLLLYIFFGVVWFVDFLIPEEVRNANNLDKREKEFNESEIKVDFPQDDTTITLEQEVVSEANDEGGDPRTIETGLELVLPENRQMTSEEMDIGKKAHALGKRVRTELQKPQYNLNHIMSTLSQEDFSHAYRVDKEGYNFDSTQGHWSPPKDLVLFPIELENYDYRRTDQILLLGFNRPLEATSAKFSANWGDSEEKTIRMSGNQVQIGDTTFHMKTLVLTKNQWEDARNQLEYIDDTDNISYTGFSTLYEMQEKLAQMSEKWIQLRKQAEVAVVNFIAGVLGSNEPIFMGKSVLEESQQDYLVESVEDGENGATNK